MKMSIKSSTPQDFANSMAQLENILETMERGDLSLEDSLLKYEDGIKLIRTCQQTLDTAQQKIKTLNTNNLLDDTQNDK
jgi:exodeoxyribonuclease VII small subunit